MELQITVVNSGLRESSDISSIVSEIGRFKPAGIEGVVRILQAESDGEVCLQFVGDDGRCVPAQGKVVVLTSPMVQKAESRGGVVPTVRRFLQSIIAVCELERMRGKDPGAL